MLLADGFQIEKVMAGQEQISKRDVSQYSAIVVLGGPMAVYEHLESVEQELKLAAKAANKDIPVLGICLGSQIVAQAMGGRVYKGSKKEIGWGPVKLTPVARKQVFRGLGETIDVFHWHGDTFDLPDDAIVLANSENYIQAFQIGSALGIQFHPEVNLDMIKIWAREYAAETRAEGISAEEMLSQTELAAELNRTCTVFCKNFVSDFIRKNLHS